MLTTNEDTWIDWIDQLSLQDYVIIDKALSGTLFHQISDFFQQYLQGNEFTKAGIGAQHQHHVNRAIRGDYVYWLQQERDMVFLPFFEYMDQWQHYINRYCFLSLSGYEFHLAHYPAGTFYKRHIDQFKERSNRLITVLLYLNEHWQKGDGGELVLYQDNREIVIEPVGNRMLLFKSDCIEHEVLMTNKSRYSLTGWLLNKPVGLGYLT